MHCHKVRLSLENKIPLDAELLEHLRGCPSCAALANAERLLDGAMMALRGERPDESTPLSVIRANLAMRQNQKEISIMAKITDTIWGHRRLTFGIGLGLLALIFFIAVPLPYQRTVGYNVSVAGLPGEISGEALRTGLASIGQEAADVRVASSNGTTSYTISNLPDARAARAVIAAMIALSGIEVDATITPIVETVSASLYAQARERKVTIEVDGAGKTDDQIKAEIESKLAAQGLQPAFVFIKTDSTGKRNIRLQIDEQGDGDVPARHTIEVDARGKTDAQIEAEVKARLAEQGRPNADVKVERSGADSLRQIRIEIEDTTGH